MEGKLQRLRRAARQRNELLEKRSRKERLRKAEMLSLEHKLKGLVVATEFVDTGRGLKKGKRMVSYRF